MSMDNATGNCFTVPNSWMTRPFWCSQGWLPSDLCSTDDDFGLLTPCSFRRTEDCAGAVRPAPIPPPTVDQPSAAPANAGGLYGRSPSA
ncbi:hypothetical protein GCM10010385_07590 [Streptomyces geysiriensis]|nr:hypothetical protein GCM10010385_07590 [Streptomyces geysiriensis]GGZ50938.1 hypothetical protein GCM10010301_24810 [Streptomyces plicatus]GHC42410.1 hypothetical protein GCM10010308_71980 [Streptomyces vinaceusdrappus]